jgi:hypothetical protein
LKHLIFQTIFFGTFFGAPSCVTVDAALQFFGNFNLERDVEILLMSATPFFSPGFIHYVKKNGPQQPCAAGSLSPINQIKLSFLPGQGLKILSVNFRLLVIVKCQRSTVNGQWSTVNGQPSKVSRSFLSWSSRLPFPFFVVVILLRFGCRNGS